MEHLNRTIHEIRNYPERILQFGAGNFLRGFIDDFIQELNEKINFNTGVVIVKPTSTGNYNQLIKQEGLYTLFLKGIKNGKAVSEYKIIDCIQRCVNPYDNYDQYLSLAQNPELRFIVSNTTEAGIVYEPNDTSHDAPQKSFPGKLTALLHSRFVHFGGASDKGLIVLPCELIDKNGDNLKRIILQYAEDWNLGEGFVQWINNDNIFCNTLVDRIVPGYPKNKMDDITKQLGYKDDLVVEGEQFHLWVIEGPKEVKEEFPAMECGLNVVFTDNMEPYRTRKVRVLNGAHTTLVPVGYLFGLDKVRDSLEDPVVGSFLKHAIFDEICPTLDLPDEELKQFSNKVLDRFRNPFLEHALISISLNSIAKYKTRVLPSVLEYINRKNTLPKRLLFSLAALIAFYKGERNGEFIGLNDDQEVLDFFQKQWSTNNYDAIVKNVLSNRDFWSVDLTKYKGLQDLVTTNLESIMVHGMQKTLKSMA
ncbi:MAG: tagaturonate reductase [Maribacter sp.]|nr:tagaturonate reductase [Maribacter sp.]